MEVRRLRSCHDEILVHPPVSSMRAVVYLELANNLNCLLLFHYIIMIHELTLIHTDTAHIYDTDQ